MIPDEAVEAAAKALGIGPHGISRTHLELALEAAAPHLMAQLAISLLEGMEAWAGDKEIGFLEGFIEAAEEEARK